MQSLPVTFPKEWSEFADCFSRFAERKSALDTTVRRVFERSVIPSTPAFKVVFALGSVIPDEFSELVHLCAHGYAIGANKILRGMYEKAVTVGYLSLHPENCQTFMDYGRVNHWKLYCHAKAEIDASGLLPLDEIAEMKASYERVKGKFEKLGKSGKPYVRSSWSELDLLSMARKADQNFGDLYVYCYFQPTLHIHATVTAMLSQYFPQTEDTATIGRKNQERNAIVALCGGHCVLLLALHTQNRFFKLGLEGELRRRLAEYAEIFGKVSTPVSGELSNPRSADRGKAKGRNGG